MKVPEIEVKILGINIDEIKSKVIDLGGSLDGIYTVRDTFYDFNGNKLSIQGITNTDLQILLSEAYELFEITGSFKDHKIFFRLRDKDRKNELTLKTVNSRENGVSNNVESNFKFSSEKELDQFFKFQSNHLNEIALHEKRRTKLKLSSPEVVIDVDEYSCLPAYLEIEAESSELIEDAINELGLTRNERTTKSGKTFFEMFGVNFFSETVFEAGN